MRASVRRLSTDSKDDSDKSDGSDLPYVSFNQFPVDRVKETADDVYPRLGKVQKQQQTSRSNKNFVKLQQNILYGRHKQNVRLPM
jgi:hypothetical protein